jgi:hypothetical protein
MGVLPCKLCKVRFNFVDCSQMENVTIEFPNKRVVGLAEMRRDLYDLVENRL